MTTVRIIVTLKPGVLDAQGQAVLAGLRALGYAQIADVRVGRYLELTVPGPLAAGELRELCERVLANPLIEEWRLDAVDGREPSAGGSPRPGAAFPRGDGAH